VLKAGVWYVVASADGQVRTYRARRITQVRDLGETFTRPPGFDLPGHWNESIAAYEGSAPRVTVTIRIRQRAISSLADLVGERALRAAERLDPQPGDEGWTRMRLSIDWPEEVPGRLVALGGAVEILEPVEMRDRALTLAREVIARYESVS
jgi:predicted DNA-binding transcriptional regulator YafY